MLLRAMDAWGKLCCVMFVKAVGAIRMDNNQQYVCMDWIE